MGKEDREAARLEAKHEQKRDSRAAEVAEANRRNANRAENQRIADEEARDSQ